MGQVAHGQNWGPKWKIDQASYTVDEQNSGPKGWGWAGREISWFGIDLDLAHAQSSIGDPVVWEK